MRRVAVLLVPGVLFALGGCAGPPTAPASVMALPTQGKNLATFQQDDLACRQYAAQQTGGAPSPAAAQGAGSATSNSSTSGTYYGAQRAYDISYAQCMTAHGDSVQAAPVAYGGYPYYYPYWSYPYGYGYPYAGYYGPAWYAPSIAFGFGGPWGWGWGGPGPWIGGPGRGPGFGGPPPFGGPGRFAGGFGGPAFAGGGFGGPGHFGGPGFGGGGLGGPGFGGGGFGGPHR
jgi:hypothetical protein